MTDSGSYTVITDSKADSQSMPPIIWRQLRGHEVTVKKADTGTKVAINECTVVCYQDGRWVH